MDGLLEPADKLGLGCDFFLRAETWGAQDEATGSGDDSGVDYASLDMSLLRRR